MRSSALPQPAIALAARVLLAVALAAGLASSAVVAEHLAPQTAQADADVDLAGRYLTRRAG